MTVEPGLGDILQELRDCRSELNGKMDTLGRTLNEKYDEIVTENKELKKEMSALKETNDGMLHKLQDLEDRSRRNNLMITGVQEVKGETWEETETKMVEAIENKLKITLRHGDVERAHRVGRAFKDKDRPIIARFSNFKTKETVITAARQRKVEGLYVNEDYSKETRDERRELVKLMKQKKVTGITAFVRYKKLIVRNTEGRENWYEMKNGEIIMSRQTFNETGTCQK